MIGTLILDQRGRYVVHGGLPERTNDDKEFLKSMVKAMQVSKLQEQKLPQSLRKQVRSVSDGYLACSIPLIAHSDVILVNRVDSEDVEVSKNCAFFRFDGYKKLDLNIEVWVKDDK